MKRKSGGVRGGYFTGGRTEPVLELSSVMGISNYSLVVALSGVLLYNPPLMVV